MHSYALNRLSPYNDMCADVPDQITLDVFDIGCGDRDECSGYLFAVIDTSGRATTVQGFREEYYVPGLGRRMRHVDVAPSLWAEVNSFLKTSAGLKAVQAEITREMERA